MMGWVRKGAFGFALAWFATWALAQPALAGPVDFRWGVRIPMRDGVELNATAYLPRGAKPTYCVFTQTPYIAQSYHDRGMYFAGHGVPFLTVDVRGRGNSQGNFTPFAQEAKDGHDIVEWLAGQSYCNGKVSMWGGSYAGYDQWVTAKERPAHLATIVPVASPYAAEDFPARNLIFGPYDLQWLLFTTGKAGQVAIFSDQAFWNERYKAWFDSGKPLSTLPEFVGFSSPFFAEWQSHPEAGAYWDALNPTSDQYAALDLPILTITGIYDDDQPGALRHYREHMAHGKKSAIARHYLVIGPWDHAGTRTPKAEFAGLKFAPASLVDLPKLHLDWYAWTMGAGAKPEFLKKRVAFYLTGAEAWRYADTLEAVTGQVKAMKLTSAGQSANSVFNAGALSEAAVTDTAPDTYVYDPRDRAIGDIEAANLEPGNLTDQRRMIALSGHELVYQTEPLAAEMDVAGFFKFQAWLGIDTPDTDFRVSIYEVLADGSVIGLTDDVLRARYRKDFTKPSLVASAAPELYTFSHFTFTARRLAKGSRLRLVIDPNVSIFAERNVNAGGVIAQESLDQAKTVTVKLFHDQAHPSMLSVPIAAP